jgi:PKD repeat protein
VRGSVWLAGITASFLAVGLAAVPAARAVASTQSSSSTQASTLYVNINGAGCGSTGPGTQAEPFCTIQQAANVVQPGQTVEVRSARSGMVAGATITSKGTQAAPITFVYEQGTGMGTLSYGPEASQPAVTFDDAQYVTFSGFSVEPYGSADGIDVIGSSNITLDKLSIMNDWLSTKPLALAAISVSGGSSDVTISRTQITGGAKNGVLAQAGTSGVVAITSHVRESGGNGITLDRATGSVVTSNTVLTVCEVSTGGGTGITLADGSSATVENNIVNSAGPTSCPTPPAALSVDTASAAGVTAGYNALFAAGSTEYSWEGVSYSHAQAFQQAVSGQGTNDIDLAKAVTYAPAEGSPVIDSANCSAPDEPSTDILGNPRVQDPLSTDASLASGTCYADRGAYERQDALSAPADTTSLSPSSTGYLAGVAPLTFGVTVPAAVTSSWGEAVTYSVSFGDGSPAVTATVGTAASHTYNSTGQYTVTITATDTSGSAEQKTFTVYALTATPPAVKLSAAPQGLGGNDLIMPDEASFAYSAGSLGWEVASASIAYGGTGGEAQPTGNPAKWSYIYAEPGTYTATVTVKDLLGRASTARTTATVGDELETVNPGVDYDHAIPAHGTVKLSLGALNGDCCSRAALVDVTVTSPQKSGTIVVYPDRSSRPDLATVQFQAGQAAENSTLALPESGGAVDFYNTSGGSVDLNVTTYGLEETTTTQGYGGIGEGYYPVTPAQVLPRTDLPPEHKTVVNVVGLNQVPANAAVVVLAVTESGAAAAGQFATYPERGLGVGAEVGGAYWAKGQQATGLATVSVAGGRAILVNGSRGNAYFTADVVGYYLNPAASTGSVFLPAKPDRLLKVTVAGKHWVKVAVAGKDGIPAASAGGAGTTAALVNLTAAGATANGSFTVYADGTSRPANVTSLSYTKGQGAATAAIVQVGKDGEIDLYNSGSRPVLAVVDVNGSFYAY